MNNKSKYKNRYNSNLAKVTVFKTRWQLGQGGLKPRQ